MRASALLWMLCGHNTHLYNFLQNVGALFRVWSRCCRALFYLCPDRLGRCPHRIGSQVCVALRSRSLGVTEELAKDRQAKRHAGADRREAMP